MDRFNRNLSIEAALRARHYLAQVFILTSKDVVDRNTANHSMYSTKSVRNDITAMNPKIPEMMSKTLLSTNSHLGGLDFPSALQGVNIPKIRNINQKCNQSHQYFEIERRNSMNPLSRERAIKIRS